MAVEPHNMSGTSARMAQAKTKSIKPIEAVYLFHVGDEVAWTCAAEGDNGKRRSGGRGRSGPRGQTTG